MKKRISIKLLVLMDENHGIIVWQRSFFLFGPDDELLDDERLNFIMVDFAFQWGSVSRVIEHWWFGIDDEVHFSSLIAPANVSGVNLWIVALSVIKFSFSFSLHEVLSVFGLGYPLSAAVANSQTQVNHIWISHCLALICHKRDRKRNVSFLVNHLTNLFSQF